MNISITTYNVLADAYVSRSRYPNCTEERINYAFRLPLILETLRTIDADIFCLQEVEQKTFDHLKEDFGSTYNCSLVLKTDKPEGVAILSRKTISVTSEETVRFQNIDSGKNQLALLSTFNASGVAFGIANTHLQWAPESTPAESHLGLKQLNEMIAATKKHEMPWILAGDFNANSQSVVVVDAERQGFMISCRQQRPWDTTNINGRRRKIDYLLCSSPTWRPSPRPLPKLERSTPMPSEIYASDHLPLTVDFLV